MKTSIKKLAEQIEASNEEFNAMSNADKRVQIARDCLIRIQLEQFEPKRGVTCSMDYDWKDENEDKSIKDLLSKKKIPDCQACAKGGLFLSYVGRVNQFNFGSIQDSTEEESNEMIKLLEIFEAKQLDGIEAAFEGSVIRDHNFITDEDHDFANNCENYRWNISSFDSKSVLKSICKNIIKNKGEFIPTDLVLPYTKIK